ncbi:MAG TPA: alanine dehydrogenase [Acidimicrobiales bacterium]|nr:alanine dehydrogenase [Acidimicrobiales bacterium]
MTDVTTAHVEGKPLVVGVPRETKPGEHRVAVAPEGVGELTRRGVPVLVEVGAGMDSGIGDGEYRAAGAEVVDRAAEVWERADLVCKVKEPQVDELDWLRPGLVLFAYLHLAAYPALAAALLHGGVAAVAFETVQSHTGGLPLLTPMSEVAGRMAPQVGARFLEREAGGRGMLLGGVPGVAPARVVILGAGTVGCAAAVIAQGMGAEVQLLNRGIERLQRVDQLHRGRIITIASMAATIERSVVDADLVVGAVLRPGGRAPVLVGKDLVAAMRPGSVIVDVAVDQGGCVESTRETTHADPVYEDHGVLHYAVGNMPAAVPRTSTYALANANLPYVVRLATAGVRRAARQDDTLARGINTLDGAIVHPAVADALDRPLADLDAALRSGK